MYECVQNLYITKLRNNLFVEKFYFFLRNTKLICLLKSFIS